MVTCSYQFVYALAIPVFIYELDGEKKMLFLSLYTYLNTYFIRSVWRTEIEIESL